MTCLSVNLIPRKRRDAKRTAARIRIWAVLVGVYAFSLGAAYVVVSAMSNRTDDAAARELAALSTQITSAREELTRARADLTAQTRLLGDAQEVQGHADWSALLALIAARKGDGLAMASLELRAAGREQNDSPLLNRPARYTLRLTGLARDHKAVTMFTLDLEKTQLFARVVLGESTPRRSGDKTIVSFAIDCTLDEIGPGIAGAEGKNP